LKTDDGTETQTMALTPPDTSNLIVFHVTLICHILWLLAVISSRLICNWTF